MKSLTEQFLLAATFMRNQDSIPGYTSATEALCDRFKTLWVDAGPEARMELSALMAKEIKAQAAAINDQMQHCPIATVASATDTLLDTFLRTVGRSYIPGDLALYLESEAAKLKESSDKQDLDSFRSVLSESAEILMRRARQLKIWDLKNNCHPAA